MFIGLTAIVAVLVAIIAFALLRFVAGAREAKRQLSGSTETALLSAALQEAVGKLKSQEQAMSARAHPHPLAPLIGALLFARLSGYGFAIVAERRVPF